MRAQHVLPYCSHRRPASPLAARWAPLLGLACAWAATPAAHAAPWERPQTVVAGVEGRLAEPAVAVDERGSAVATAVLRRDGRDRLVGARSVRGGTFGRWFVLQPPVSLIDAPTVEFDGRRRAFVAYRRTHRGRWSIGATTIAPDGTRRTPTLFTGLHGAPSAPRFADPPFDRPLLVWHDVADGRVNAYATQAERSGRYDRTARFALGSAATGDVAVAAEPRGGALVAFVREEPSTGLDRVVAARRRPGSTRYVTVAVSAPGRPRDVAVAVTRSGRAAIVWSEPSGDARRWHVAVRPAGRTGFGAARTLFAETTGRMQVTATAADRFLLTWRTPGGGLVAGPLDRPSRAISHPRAVVGDVRVRADGGGAVTLAYREAPGIVRAVRIGPGGALEGPHRLSRPGRRASAIALGTGTRGDAVAAWIEDDGRRMRAARRPS